MKRLRLLIVEDSEDDAELLVREVRRSETFELAYRRVDTAEAMRAALRAEEWDAVMCDYNVAGFGAAEAIAIAREDGRDEPFIVVSGTVKEEMAVEVLKAGAHDFVVKDRLARLVPAIVRELREAQLRRERRQALEDLKLALQARDEFLSIASHELKTPITSLELQLWSALGLVRGRSLEGLGEKLTSKLRSAACQVDRLTALINNLLDVTRMTSGRMRVVKRETDLAQVVRDVAARFRELSAGEPTELRVEASNPTLGSWDPVLLETIVNNLVSNAMKFGAGKPVDVTVSAGASRAKLTVTDQGLGIGSRDQRRIFGRFERAVPESHFGGLGVGLWIARKATEAHGGRIRVSSAPGEGATFVVELPRSRTEA